MGYRIGLDIGIGSVGWAVVENDKKGKPIRIIDLGSRIFNVTENQQLGKSFGTIRREEKSARRTLRRKKHRIERTKRLLKRYNILSKIELENLYKNKNYDIYKLRVKALEEKLTNEELAVVLLYMMKRRGYKLSNIHKKQENTGKIIEEIKQNEILMKRI